MLDGLGVATGVDLDKLLDVSEFVANTLAIPVRSKVFPAKRGERAQAGRR
jgi:hypothetical protein